MLSQKQVTRSIFVIYDSNDVANQIKFTTIDNLYDYQKREPFIIQNLTGVLYMDLLDNPLLTIPE